MQNIATIPSLLQFISAFPNAITCLFGVNLPNKVLLLLLLLLFSYEKNAIARTTDRSTCCTKQMLPQAKDNGLRKISTNKPQRYVCSNSTE